MRNRSGDRITGSVDINVALAFLFGIIFISVVLGFAVLVERPSPFAQWAFAITTALAGAGVGAVIPGILKVTLPYVKAGGALAVFALVLLNKPALVATTEKFRPPTDPSVPVAMEYLELVDRKALQAAWSSLDSEAKKSVARDRDAYRLAYENGRDPLGLVEKRVPMGTAELTSPPGYPTGIYRGVSFRTKFGAGCHAEQVTLRSAEDSQWRVYEHMINPSQIPCL